MSIGFDIVLVLLVIYIAFVRFVRSGWNEQIRTRLGMALSYKDDSSFFDAPTCVQLGNGRKRASGTPIGLIVRLLGFLLLNSSNFALVRTSQWLTV